MPSCSSSCSKFWHVAAAAVTAAAASATLVRASNCPEKCVFRLPDYHSSYCPYLSGNAEDMDSMEYVFEGCGQNGSDPDLCCWRLLFKRENEESRPILLTTPFLETEARGCGDELRRFLTGALVEKLDTEACERDAGLGTDRLNVAFKKHVLTPLNDDGFVTVYDDIDLLLPRLTLPMVGWIIVAATIMSPSFGTYVLPRKLEMARLCIHLIMYLYGLAVIVSLPSGHKDTYGNYWEGHDFFPAYAVGMAPFALGLWPSLATITEICFGNLAPKKRNYLVVAATAVVCTAFASALCVYLGLVRVGGMSLGDWRVVNPLLIILDFFVFDLVLCVGAFLALCYLVCLPLWLVATLVLAIKHVADEGSGYSSVFLVTGCIFAVPFLYRRITDLCSGEKLARRGLADARETATAYMVLACVLGPYVAAMCSMGINVVEGDPSLVSEWMSLRFSAQVIPSFKEPQHSWGFKLSLQLEEGLLAFALPAFPQVWMARGSLLTFGIQDLSFIYGLAWLEVLIVSPVCRLCLRVKRTAQSRPVSTASLYGKPIGKNGEEIPDLASERATPITFSSPTSQESPAPQTSILPGCPDSSPPHKVIALVTDADELSVHIDFIDGSAKREDAPRGLRDVPPILIPSPTPSES